MEKDILVSLDKVLEIVKLKIEDVKSRIDNSNKFIEDFKNKQNEDGSFEDLEDNLNYENEQGYNGAFNGELMDLLNIVDTLTSIQRKSSDRLIFETTRFIMENIQFQTYDDFTSTPSGLIKNIIENGETIEEIKELEDEEFIITLEMDNTSSTINEIAHKAIESINKK